MRGGAWVTEEQAPGVRFSLAVVEPILHLRTPHQELDLARTHALGQVLTLDGRIMVTERDEAFYHEMLVHPALLVHDRPERVLVVGGGDGGALRAVLSHPPVREVTLVEIDADVVACCRAHLAAVHGGAFDDPADKPQSPVPVVGPVDSAFGVMIHRFTRFRRAAWPRRCSQAHPLKA